MPWVLLAVIAVDPDRRVQCQCKGCGHHIYAAIHMVELPGPEIQCWGSDCYAREARLAAAPKTDPLYPGPGGRKLTDQEREWLTSNRQRLIAEFEAQHMEALRLAEEARQAAQRKRIQLPTQAKTKPVQVLPDGDDNAADALVASPYRPASLPSVKVPPVDYTRPLPREPMHDARYRQIRERKVQQWLSRGIDLTMMFHFKSLIENCLHDYDRRR